MSGPDPLSENPMDGFQFELPGMSGRIFQAIMTLTQARSWSEAKRIVLQYPELLSEEADDMLEWFGMMEPVPSNKEFFQKLREVLHHARLEGMETAFVSRTGPDIPSGPAVEIPAGFEAEIQQLAELAEIAQRDARFYSQQIQLIEGVLSRLPPGSYLNFRGSLFSFLGYAYENLTIGDRRENLQTAMAAYREALRFTNPDEFPEGYANAQYLLGHACYYLGNFYFRSPTGGRAENLQQAIAAYRETLRYWTPESTPQGYAWTQHDLGVSYTNLSVGDRRENLQKAIVAYQEALRFWRPQTDPKEYAMAQFNLGVAYSGLPSGDQAEDLQQAIAAYLEALLFYTVEDSPLDYAKIQNNLGNAYTHLSIGNRGDNVQKAIAAYREALRGWTPQSSPLNYSMAWYNLGSAYADLPSGDREENIQQAIAAFQKALDFLPPNADPLDYAKIQHNLGHAYADLPGDALSENLRKAIAAYREALRFRTLESAPSDFAKTQTLLGTAYFNLHAGDREENLQQAASAYQEALRFWNPEDTPQDYAWIQSELGDAYVEMKSGDRATNFERAIAAFREALRFITPETDSIAYANIQSKLGLAYAQLPVGDRGENLQNAIAAYHETLRFHTPETYPLAYAAVQKNLGEAYLNLPAGDRTENLQKAISALEETIRYWDPDTVRSLTPKDLEAMGGIEPINLSVLSYSFAETQNNLGVAYFELTAGDRVENLRKAIAAFQESLSFFTPSRSPMIYAQTQYNLGSSYVQLPTSDRAENMQQALAAFHEALRFFTAEDTPLEYANTQSNLGIAYAGLQSGNQVENLQQAMAAFQEALRFHTPEAAPLEYAQTQHNLGNVHRYLPAGDQVENLQQAIACYREALRFRSPEAEPREYAVTQTHLGIAFVDLPIGNRVENLKQATAAFREALRYLSPESAPLDVALAQNELGIAYARLPVGNRGEHLRRAIAHFQEALRFWTPENAPLDYARAHANLGAAYNDLPTGDMVENLYRAVFHFQEALRFWTPEDAPLDYATAQYNLGVAYHNLPDGDREQNLKQAISHYQEALRFRSAETTPWDFAKTQSSLGNAYLEGRHWEQAHGAYSSGIYALDILYQVTSTGVARQAVLAEAANIFSNDAYCLARLGKYDEAVDRLEAGKTRILAEALARDRAALAQAEPLDRAAFESARDRIKNLESEARALAAAGSDSASARQYLQTSAELTAARQELAAVVERIRSYLSEFMPVGLDFPSIAATAAQDCPLIYLITTTRGSLGLIVLSNTKTMTAESCVWMDDFNSHDLDRLLMERNAGAVTGGYLFGQVEGDLSALQSGLDQALPVLGQQLVGPLGRRLVELGYRRAFLIPGGLLSLLPLPSADLETITLTFAPSARAIQATQQTVEERDSLPPILLGIGNPLPNSQPLAFARIEVEAIAPRFPDSSQHLLYERQATRASVLENIPGATHLHFSCHGIFDSNEPLDSALFLSGEDTLKLRDLLEGNMDLSHSRLAVLSACQTGIADYNRVPDEAVGFPAGFLQAGVPGVISTLWPVNDLSTALLLARFYRYHLQGGLDPATSLCLAQRWLRDSTARQLGLADWYERLYRKSGRHDRVAFQAMRYYQANPNVQPFNHPYYWAAFTFTGV